MADVVSGFSLQQHCRPNRHCGFDNPKNREEIGLLYCLALKIRRKISKWAKENLGYWYTVAKILSLVHIEIKKSNLAVSFSSSNISIIFSKLPKGPGHFSIAWKISYVFKPPTQASSTTYTNSSRTWSLKKWESGGIQRSKPIDTMDLENTDFSNLISAHLLRG